MREKKYFFSKDSKHVADQYKANLEAEGWIVTLDTIENGNFQLYAIQRPKTKQKVR